MKRSRKFVNPFYSLLLAAGIAFALTATAYVVMSFRDVQAARVHLAQEREPSDIPHADHPLMLWMREHGEATLLTELGLLALCTFGAIGTDDYWQRRAKQRTVI
jgi:putative exporter of polyketide antibiotics